jgi:hypothetical protein
MSEDSFNANVTLREKLSAPCLLSQGKKNRQFFIFALEPVGLRESKRKFGWARTDFVDFAG